MEDARPCQYESASKVIKIRPNWFQDRHFHEEQPADLRMKPDKNEPVSNPPRIHWLENKREMKPKCSKEIEAATTITPSEANIQTIEA